MIRSPAFPDALASAVPQRLPRATGAAVRTIAGAVAVSLVLQTAALAGDPSTASAASVNASAASATSVAATGSVIVEGGALALSALGTAVVASVETAGDVSVVVLRGVSDAATVTLRLVGGASLVVGSVITVVVTATGYALMTAGRMIAFVPNEIGRSLVRQRPLASAR